MATNNLKPWVQGQSGNPGGRPKDLLSRIKVRNVLSRFANLSRVELLDIFKDETTPMLESMIASIMLKALKTGDQSKVEFLFQRAYGKVKDEVDITTHNPQEEELRKLSLEQLIIFIQSNHITKAIE